MGPPQPRRDIAVLLKATDILTRQVAGHQLVGDVVRFDGQPGVAEAQPTGELIAAVPLDDVDLHAAGVAIGADAARLDNDLRERRLVEDEHAIGNPDHLAHAVHNRLRHRRAMQREGVLRRVVDAADAVLRRLLQGGAGNHAGQSREAAGGRERLQRLALKLRLLPRTLDIDHRRFRRHRDRLVNGPDAHLHVDRRGEVSRQRQRVTLQRSETGKGEGHGVFARAQIHEPVDTTLVGHGNADLLDQRWAGRFDRDTGKHRPRGVAHHARNAAGLRIRVAWPVHQHADHTEHRDASEQFHGFSS